MFVERYRERLKTVAASYCATGAQGTDGAVNVGLGLKGMIVVELTASGATWRHGPKASIHSSAAGLVSSPPFRLAQALATLTDKNGHGCAVALSDRGVATDVWPIQPGGGPWTVVPNAFNVPCIRGGAIGGGGGGVTNEYLVIEG